MTITIPTWLLWIAGVPVGLLILVLVGLGVQFLLFIVNMMRR